MKKYHYSENGQQYGAITLEELKTKNIKPDTLIWYEGISEWTAANNIAELQDMFSETSVPPPLPNLSAMPPPLQNNVNKEAQVATKNDDKFEKYYLYTIGVGVFLNFIAIFQTDSSLSWLIGTAIIGIGVVGWVSKVKFAIKQHIWVAILLGGIAGWLIGVWSIHLPFTIQYSLNTPNSNTETTNQASTTTPTENQVNVEAERQKEIDRQQMKEFIIRQKDLRNSCLNYISVVPSYNASTFGGLSNVTVKVTNNLGYTINEIVLEVSYKKTLGGIAQTETVKITNIKYGKSKSVECPSSDRGTSVSADVFTMRVRDIGLCYTMMMGMRMDSPDPFLCADMQ